MTIHTIIVLALCVFTYHAPVQALSIDEAFERLQPENALERLIISHPEWIEGAHEGKPRPGHPEGQIVYHVLEVLQNAA